MMKGQISQQQPQQQQQQQVAVDENMSNLTCASGEASGSSGNMYSQQYSNLAPPQNQTESQSQSQPVKRKRNLPGNPDPDAEVIALSPKTLLTTNRFVCEICNKGFQRDQNLQLHRRGHNLPWKLKQRTNKEVRKKVYVCPELSCVHHDPSRALGDLTGIKKHFFRKHGEKKWKCEKCSKRYAVQSDWKAHSKTCGTKEYRCDCGTLFSRRDSFITHRAFCDALAEESARAITGNIPNNPLFNNHLQSAVTPQGSSSTTSHHHFINNNLHHQIPPNQFDNHQSHLQPFTLKKEPQTTAFNLRPEFPQWLAYPPSVGPTPTHPQIDLGPSSIMPRRFDQDYRDQELGTTAGHHHQEGCRNPNPSSSSSSLGGPHSSSLTLLPYHPSAATPHISATALLQKAAQMGVSNSSSCSNNSNSSKTNSAMLQQQQGGPHQTHVSPESSHNNNNNNNNGNVNSGNTAGGFSLNLSSREEFINSLATGGPNPHPPPTNLFHDMMMSSFSSSTSAVGNCFDDAFGFLHPNNNSKKHEDPSRNELQFDGNNNEGTMTRDFLGLRPLSHSDIFSIAGLSSCITATTSNNNEHHQAPSQKPWQG